METASSALQWDKVNWKVLGGMEACLWLASRTLRHGLSFNVAFSEQPRKTGTSQMHGDRPQLLKACDMVGVILGWGTALTQLWGVLSSVTPIWAYWV